MKRLVAALAPLAVFVAASCSEAKDRPPAAPLCTSGTNCNTGPGVGTSNSTGDAGTDTPLGDAQFEVGDGGVPVVATVRPVSKFVTDPYTVTTFDTANVAIRAPRAGGGTDIEASMPAADGSYTLSGVAPAIGAPTWIEVVKMGARRTIAAIDATAPPAMGGYSLPLFADLLPQTTWSNVVVGTPAYPPGSATVVAHIYRADGVRKPGVRAAKSGTASGPYYDDGTDISATSTANATGVNATIVFLGITGVSRFDLNLTDTTTGKSYPTVLVPVAADAVTHLALRL